MSLSPLIPPLLTLSSAPSSFTLSMSHLAVSLWPSESRERSSKLARRTVRFLLSDFPENSCFLRLEIWFGNSHFPHPDAVTRSTVSLCCFEALTMNSSFKVSLHSPLSLPLRLFRYVNCSRTPVNLTVRSDEKHPGLKTGARKVQNLLR